MERQYYNCVSLLKVTGLDSPAHIHTRPFLKPRCVTLRETTNGASQPDRQTDKPTIVILSIGGDTATHYEPPSKREREIQYTVDDKFTGSINR